MPYFKYRARDREGALITGALEAVDRGTIETTLDRMGLIPINISVSESALRMSEGRLSALKDIFIKPPQQEIILFSRQLSTLFSAGVPLTRSLTLLEKQMRNKSFVVAIRRIREDVEGGESFSAALAKHPVYFPELYSNMVAAGEAGGILDNVLDRLAFMYEKNAENRAKVKSATLYPKIVVGAIAIAITILMHFVVPKFASLYSSFKVALPLPTRALIILSNTFSAYWYVVLISGLSAFVGLKLYISTDSGRYNWDRLMLKVPIFGPLMLKAMLSRFSRVLGSLYKSGLPILQSLDIVSRAVENRLVSEDVKKIEDDVRAGKPLSEPMGRSKFFPPMVVQMVTVGEETGNLDEMLEKVAQYYDSEVDASIRNLTTTLEPVLLSFIFVMVLFLALAIFLPMWDILKVVRR